MNLRCFVLAIVMAGASSTGAQTPTYDLVIRGGRIVDGTGAPSYRADLAVLNGRISVIGRPDTTKARRVIDATGLVVAPGFIDMMGQSADMFTRGPADVAINLLSQGITTINAGEGESSAPVASGAAGAVGWSTMREYFRRLEAAGTPLNVAQTVGHTTIRQIVIGDSARQASPAELQRMRGMVEEAMQAGAIGVSTALIYPPAVYASEEEITALTSVAGRYGGRYFTHMRNEGDRLLEAIDEALRIGRNARTPVHIFHLKTAGQANWGKMDLALARIREARAGGQDVAVDVYPYVNNGLDIRALIHPRNAEAGQDALTKRLGDPAMRARIRKEMEEETGWENWYVHAGRDWDRIVLGGITNPEYKQYGGLSIKAIADRVKKDPWDVFFAIAESGPAFAMPQSMSEANKIKAMREEFTSFDTDVGPASNAIATHPRAYGAFPRIFARYVRELGVLSLEGAVQRASAVAANEIGAYDRGRLAPGLAADIVLFDPLRIRDRATFAEPSLPSEGVIYTMVNGVVVFEAGKYTGAKPGVVLRGPGWDGRK
ncbi:MAG TPA: D-aminoacylase [Gemmatimonadaceae bacterium]